MKIAFVGMGGINKVHAQAAQTLGLELDEYESCGCGVCEFANRKSRRG